MRRASHRAYPTIAGLLLLLAGARSAFALSQTWDRAHQSLQTTIELVVERGPDYHSCWSVTHRPARTAILSEPTDAARSILAALRSAYDARAEFLLRSCAGRGSASLALLASVRRGCIPHASAEDPLLKSNLVHFD